MLTLTFSAVVLGTLVVLAVQTESSQQTLAANVSISCAPGQTACAAGCCPFPDAVCCSDGYECCQHGQICLSYIGICIALEDKKQTKAALVSSAEKPLEALAPPCPSGTTTCAPGKCCRYPNANCCSDMAHCCPNGYRCDLIGKRCIKYFENELELDEIPFMDGKTPVLQKKIVFNPSLKTCPGSSTKCPSYTSCCLNDEGDWNCCPKPSSNVFNKVGTNECCSTVYGYVCCPDVAPHCTMWGCRP